MKLIDFLCEVGNTKAEIKWNYSNPHGPFGDFTFNGLQYRIMLETNYEPTLSKIFSGKSHAFVSFLFFNPKTQKYTQDTTGLVGPQASAVFSIVKNAILPMFEAKYDILFFSAKKDRSPTGYDSRVKLYNHLYSRIIHETGCSGYVVPGKDSVTYIVAKQPIDKEIYLIKSNYTF